MDALVERPLPLYAVLLLVTVMLPAARARTLAAAGLLLSALGIAAERAGGPGNGTSFTTINEILIGAGAVIVVLAAIRARTAPRGHGEPLRNGSSPLRDPLLFAGLLLSVLGPHLILVAAGLFLALLSGAAASLRHRRAPWVGVIALGALLLCSGLFLVFTILGPLGARMNQLAAGPFSPPAERLLAILLGLGSLGLAGIFPLHRAPWGVALSPVAAILLWRMLIPALPEGLGDWQAPAMLWLAVALGFSAFSGRWAAAMVAGGLLGLWSGEATAVAPALVLLGCGWLAEMLAPALRSAEAGRWHGVWLALPLGAIPFVLMGALQAQVLISALALAAAATGLILESRRRAEAG